jgi:hypothetical protein
MTELGFWAVARKNPGYLALVEPDGTHLDTAGAR